MNVLENHKRKSVGNYFYVKKAELKSDFTQIPNALFYTNLSATEKLILAYLLSNAESFRITVYRIAKSVGSDHRTIKKAIKKFREMKLIVQITNKTIAININEIIKLAAVSSSEEKYNSNLPISTIPTNSTITNSNSPSSIVVQLPAGSSNSTTKIPGELPNNNIKQEEIKEEKQNEAFVSFSPTEIQNSIDDYLSKASIFFPGDNRNVVVNSYTDYYNQYQRTTLSIYKFEQILYYQLLGITMSKDVNDLNNYISTHPLTVQPADVHSTNRIIGENSNIKDGFNKIIEEVYANINDNVN